jgi:dTMP kinase
VLDRYVSANQIHQGGKIRDVKKRTKFISWLEIMEHKIFGIPRPDIIFYLHLPTKQSLELMKGRSSKGRSYITRGKKDQHENNIEHLQHAEESALWLSTRQKRWKKIECACPEGILPREVIHEKLWSVVRTRLPR